MKRVSHRGFLHITNVICTIGEEKFEIGTITMELSYKLPTHNQGEFLLSNRSTTRLLNKISGQFGVKVRDIKLEYHTIIGDENLTFIIPHSCQIITNLRTERRNKIKVILSH
jgi:hypothetical protein